jgi:hypothetical protein
MKKFYCLFLKAFLVCCILSVITISFKATAQVPACTPSMLPANGGVLISPATPFTWTVPSGTVTGYKIYIGTTTAATEIINGTTVTTTSYTYTGGTLFNCGTTYYWKVVPYNGSGNAVGCTVQSFTLTNPGDPTVFPVGSWNAYCYNSTNWTNYTGYYTSTGQDFNSTTIWNTNYSPSSAAPNGATTYQGCGMPVDNHSVIYKRQGFTPGTYSLNVLNDDGCVLYLNGVQIYARASYTPSFINSVWTGNLDASSQIEFRWTEGGGGSSGGITFVPVATPTLVAGTIAGDQILCPGSDPLAFTSTLAASGTCSSAISYQWQQDVGCTGTFSDISGATTATYDVPAGISTTTCYARKITDINCGRTALTNTVTVTITSVQQGDPTVFPSNTWNGYVFDFSGTGYTSTDDNWTAYKGFFTYGGASSSDPSFNTTSIYRVINVPSSGPSYAGCQVGATLSGIQMKRQGFPVGTYQIDFVSDDAGYLYINGALVYSRTTNGSQTNVWTGNLDGSSTIDFHYKNNAGASTGTLTFTLVTPTVPLSEGAIALGGPGSICPGNTPATIISTVAAQSSCYFTYQWQADSTGTGYVDIAGATAATYSPPILSKSTSFKRKAIDACGSVAYSNIVTVTIGPSTPPDPSVFGSNSWIAYAYNAQNFVQLYGSYTDPGASSTDPSFYSGSKWQEALSPSYADTYTGCQVGVDNHSVIYKRQGFTPGTYSLSVINDDACSLYINGILVYSRGSYTPTYINAVWIGNLDATSKIEFRWTEGGGNSDGGITFLQVSTPNPLVGGTIANANSSVCPGDTPAAFTSSANPSGGCSVATYQWQSSTDGTTYTDISGATLGTYAPAAITATTYYKRKVTDFCSQVAYSNAVTISVVTPTLPDPSVFGNNVWNVYAYNDVTFTTLRGMYVDNGFSSTDPSFDSRDIWATGLSPSYAPGYSGCQVVLDQHGVIYKRRGFPAGIYRLDYNSDDAGSVYINGVLVYTSVSWGTLVTNIWTGSLDATSTIEYRWADTGGGASYGSLLMTYPVTPATLAGGTIANTTSAVCSGNVPPAFTSTAAASGGCYSSYQWESNTGSGYTSISGATSATYSPVAQTVNTSYRRKVTDICSNTAYSNVVTITVGTPTAPTVTFGSNVWNVYVYNTGNSTNTFSQLYGSYVDNGISSSNPSFDTRLLWATLAAPSTAPGYVGCQTGVDHFGVVYKRQGFPTGTYTIDFDADDYGWVYVNGTLVYSRTASCCALVTSVWSGTLNATSTVEYRMADNTSSSYGLLTFNNSSAPATLTGGTIGTNQTICTNVVPATLTSVTDATSGCGITYQWQYSTTSATGPWTNTGGNTKTLSFSPPGATQTIYYIRNATDNCGRTASSNVVSITIQPKPSNAGALTGPVSVCSGQAGVAYSIAAVANATSYTWTVPSGAIITSGAGTNAIVVTFGSTSGTVQVIPVNTCGTGTYASATVAVNPGAPAASGAISGLTSVCAGQYAVNYSVAAVSTASLYTWTVPTGATITSATNTNAITVTFGSTAGNVTVTPSNGCGSASTTSLAVSINPIPGAAGTISGLGSVCPNQTGIAYSISAVTNATSYSWSLPSGATITSGSGTRSIVVTFGSVTGNVVATPVNTCGNGTVSVKTVTVKSLTSPTSITGPSLVCGGTAGLKYSIPAVTGATGYTWTIPSGSAITAGSGTRIITLTAGTVNDNITITPFNSCGNGTTVTQAISVTNGVPAAAGTMTGSTSVCLGDTVVPYSIASVTGATGYTWTVPSGATIKSGSGTTSILVNYGSSSGNIIVKPTNICGNGLADTLAITVNRVPAAVGNITGPVTVCAGQTGVTYSIGSVARATNYNWTVPAGSTIVSGAGTTSITVNFGSTSDNVTVTPTNTCGSGTSNAKAVTVNTIPSDPGAIIGATSVCAGQTGVTYSISSVTGATGYTWTLPAGTSITSGVNTNSIIVKIGTVSGGISVTPLNTCGNSVNSATASITVTAVPAVAGSITGSTTVCAGQTGVTYSISSVTGATGYNWTVPSGSTITSGANTPSITVTIGSTSGTVSVTPTNTCGSATFATSTSVTVNTIPAVAGSITGSTTVCAGQTSVTYSISSVTGATGYSWTAPSGSTITSGANTTSITVTYGPTSGTVSVTPTNTCGSATSATSTSVTVNTIPAVAGSITGSTTVCAGQIGVTYSISAVGGATGYSWTAPSGSTITSGANTTSITVTIGSTSGTVSVTPTNTCGSATSATSTSVTVNTIPAVAGSITGATTVCAGQTGVTYSISSVTGATGYSWTVPSGSMITSGTNTTFITVTIGSASGTVSVTPINTCGSATSATITSVTVTPIPSAPTTVSGSGCINSAIALTASGSPGSYNWYTLASGGTLVSTGAAYSPVLSTTTTYYVEATNGSCISTSRTSVTATIITCSNSWIGVTSIDWNTATNWGLGVVPASGDSVIVPASASVPYSPTISANASSNKLTINSGGQLTLASTGALNSYGNIINNGIVTASAGSSVIFTGNTAQTMTGVPVLYNMKINNTSGVSVLSALSVKGTISLTSGVLTTGNNIVLDFDGGGNIGYNPLDAGSVSGNMRGRRVFVARTHYICSPFINNTSNDVAAYMPLYNTTSKTWLMSSKVFSTQGWSAVTNTTTTMPRGTGFSLAIMTAGPLAFSGGYDHTFTLTGPGYSNAAAGKFILVGNPYPSTLDWDNSLGWTKTNIGGAIYYWDAANSRTASYVGGVGTNGGTNLVPAMQSFMVATSGTGGANSSLSINNNARVPLNQSYWRTVDPGMIVKLTVSDSIGNNDETIIRFNDNATMDFDSDMDAYKVMNPGAIPSIYTNQSGSTYSINSFPGLPFRIPVSVAIPKDGKYSLQIDNSTALGNYILFDKKLGTENTITKDAYVFAGLSTDDADRFELQYRVSTNIGSQNTTLGLQISSSNKGGGFIIQTQEFGGDQARIEIMDVTGKPLVIMNNVVLSSGVTYLPLDITDGAYVVRVIVSGNAYSGLISFVK